MHQVRRTKNHVTAVEGRNKDFIWGALKKMGKETHKKAPIEPF